jgi:hypothetical protein
METVNMNIQRRDLFKKNIRVYERRTRVDMPIVHVCSVRMKGKHLSLSGVGQQTVRWQYVAHRRHDEL